MATNSYSSSNSSKVSLASTILKTFPGATNSQVHTLLSAVFGSSLRNTTLASVRRSASSK